MEHVPKREAARHCHGRSRGGRGLGVYADAHNPTGERPYSLFFTDTIQLKVWFATAAAVLAGMQVFLAARLYGKLDWPKRVPAWLGDMHRLTGTVAFLLTLPVAYQCLWALGFQSTDTASWSTRSPGASSTESSS